MSFVLIRSIIYPHHTCGYMYEYFTIDLPRAVHSPASTANFEEPLCWIQKKLWLWRAVWIWNYVSNPDLNPEHTLMTVTKWLITSAFSEISRVSRPHVERFHEALEQLPPTTVLASDNSAAECAEHSTASNVGSEDHPVDVSFDEVRALPFWNDSADSGKLESSIL